MSHADANAKPPVAGIALLAGSVLTLIGSFLVPRAADIGDVDAMQRVFAEQVVRLQVSALFLVTGFLFVAAGIVSLMLVVPARWNRELRGVAVAVHLVGIAVWMVGMSLDISYPAAIQRMVNAGDASRDTWAAVVAVLSPAGLGRGLFPVNLILNWTAFGLIGASLKRLEGYRVIAWIGVGVGVAGVALGIAMTFTGREQLIGLFVALMTLTITWWTAMAIRSLRSPAP